ncbi:hypothetical protein LPJ66_007034 [Kickxella alabastrina]|uniref:Uncharacterized protein n=1 Tax=Kickxella alabastrina TaxID=61397 RepID=A0ACC1IEC0_9FUNG|nr:hypothetical protein LPJ66_007034 [Kickxella alabastrina]
MFRQLFLKKSIVSFGAQQRPLTVAFIYAGRITATTTTTSGTINYHYQHHQSLHTSSSSSNNTHDRIPQDSYNEDNDSDTKDSAGVSDLQHEEFCKRFSKIIQAAKMNPLKPLPVDEGVRRADEQLASVLGEMFAKIKVEVTPELLERRRVLREKYPALFKDISDEDLDSK